MKKRRWRLHVSPPVAIALGVMILTDRTGVSLLTVLAALLHECGHLAAARLLRIAPGQMRLDFLGARMEITGRVLSYGEEWLLCAAGPLASLVAAAGAATLWGVSAHARIFSCASLVLGLLNLLPIRTFDGGRMLECFLSACFSERVSRGVMRACTAVLLFLLWAISAYFLLRVGDGLSLFCFSMSLFFRFFDGEKI